MTEASPSGGFAQLVPELTVQNLKTSLRFWLDILKFKIAYQRSEENFVFLERQGIQVMLCQENGNWETGILERPFGRGINFQIFVDDIAPIIIALAAAGWPLFRPPQETWYRIGDQEGGNREFLVQDPDGYLLRFAQDMGRRPWQKRKS